MVPRALHQKENQVSCLITFQIGEILSNKFNQKQANKLRLAGKTDLVKYIFLNEGLTMKVAFI